ncbi:MAG: hypothetical protein ACUVRX_04155 [Actinomycetota bacterium]
MFAPSRKWGWRAYFPALAAVLVLLASLLPFSGRRGEEAETVPVVPDMSGAEVEMPEETPGSPLDLSDYGDEARSGGTEEVMVLKDLRFGAHQGRERVVLELAPHLYDPNLGLPRYRVSYVPVPYVDAEGNRVLP